MATSGRSEEEEKLLDEIKALLTAGIKAKGDQGAVFKQTADGKVIAQFE